MSESPVAPDPTQPEDVAPPAGEPEDMAEGAVERADEAVEPADEAVERADEAGGTPEGAVEILALAERATASDFERTVREAIERGLASDTDSLRAVRNLMDMLSRYLGNWDVASYFLGLVAFESEDATTYDLVPDVAARENLRAVVGRLAGLYGREVRIGYDLSTRDPADWQYIDIRTVYELDKAEWEVAVTLHHFDQSASRLVGPPLSFLRLINRFLTQLRTLQATTGDESFRALFDEEAIGTFTEHAMGLVPTLNVMEDEQGDAGTL